MRGIAACTVVAIACGGTIDGGSDPDAPGGDPPPGTTPDAAVPGGVGEPANLAGITLAHNQVRAAVQTSSPLPFMTWSSSLAATAATWAAQCQDTQAPTGLIDHNDGRSDGHPYYVGENIYGAGGQARAQDAVDAWASEGDNYDYATNTCQGICGHYTQVVWRASVDLGCALSTCPNLQFGSAIVCNYGPGGNSGGKPY